MQPIFDPDLLQLVMPDGGERISLYMPTIPFPELGQQNRDRFIRLIQSAEDQLIQRGMLTEEAQKLLQPAKELLHKDPFWETMSYGLGALLSHGSLRVWHLPEACEELCLVGKRFYILPLLQWATERCRYYILAIGHEHVRLLKGTYSRLKEVSVANVPATVQVALSDDGTGRPRKDFSDAHDNGLEDTRKVDFVRSRDAHDQDVRRFLCEVNHAVTGVLGLRQDPLIFAGPNDLFPAYQAINTYSHLLHMHIACDPDSMAVADLHDRAVRFVEVLISDRQLSAIEKYWELPPEAQTTNRLKDILISAEAGEIETLFVTTTDAIVERFDPR